MPIADEVYRVPVLLTMSLVSKAYILDLAPGQSFVEYLLKQGFDVYMIDWGIPRPEDSRLRLEDYVLDFMPDCISRILADSAVPDLSIIDMLSNAGPDCMKAASGEALDADPALLTA